MNHLTDQQLNELLAASPRELQQMSDASELALTSTHAAQCEQCGARFASMHDSLALFREAATSYAGERQHRVPAWQPPLRGFSFPPVFWTAAAAAALLAIVLPLQMVLRQSQPPAAQQTVAAVSPHPASDSDQALLDGVSRELSESVPSPLDALADPSGSASQPSQIANQRTN